MLTLGKDYDFDLEVELLNAFDKELYDKSNVITGYCVIMDKCKSFIPLYRWIVEYYAESNDVWVIKI